MLGLGGNSLRKCSKPSIDCLFGRLFNESRTGFRVSSRKRLSESVLLIILLFMLILCYLMCIDHPYTNVKSIFMSFLFQHVGYSYKLFNYLKFYHCTHDSVLYICIVSAAWKIGAVEPHTQAEFTFGGCIIEGRDRFACLIDNNG